MDNETKQKMIDSLSEYTWTHSKEDDARTKMSEDNSYRYFELKNNDRIYYKIGKDVLNYKLGYIAGILHFNVAKQCYIKGEAVIFKKKLEAMSWALKHFEKAIK